MAMHEKTEEKHAGAQCGAGDSLPILDDGFAAAATTVEGPSRRDFLKLAGFAFASTTLSGCQRSPVRYALAPLAQPEEIVAGRSYDLASTCGGCNAGCGLLTKLRDGRPIKLEGNPKHPLSRGGLCAPGQASLLGLYDRLRLQDPLHDGRQSTWHAVDRAIRGGLDDVRKKNAAVRFLTGSLTSPTSHFQIKKFLGTFADARHVVYDARSCSAILDAHARTHGTRMLPHFHLDKAEVIVGFDADFLGNWISPVEFTAAYQAGRRLDGTAPQPSFHVQFESRLSLTGGKADQRLALAPGQLGLLMSHLATRLARKAGVALDGEKLPEPPVAEAFLDELAGRLWRSRQRSLLLCGSQDVDHQVLCNLLNHLLGNYGATVDVERPSYQWQGSDPELEKLLGEIQAGKVGALFVYACNPFHDLPAGDVLADALGSVPLVVSFAERLDETAALAHYVCPVPHYLEAWSDAEPVNGLVGLLQPAIAPLAKTRSVLESLASWMGKPQAADDLLRARWKEKVFPRWHGGGSFEDFWEHTLHEGFAEVAPEPVAARPFDANTVRMLPRVSNPPEGNYTLVLYSKVGMPDASHAYNPWLHELPDPVSKVTWDNYACLSPAAAAGLGVATGDVVRLEAAGADGRPVVLELPALVQLGQHEQVVAVALGYGSRLSERFASVGPQWLEARPTVGADGLVGKNAAPLLTWVESGLRRVRDDVRLTTTGRKHPLAASQSYDLLAVPAHLTVAGQERRPIIRESTLTAFRAELEQAAKQTGKDDPDGLRPAEPNGDLWPDDHPTNGPKWGMVIDLNACTGCSACVIACQAENNISVVGKDEVRRHREMHWIRIDRYYTEREGGVNEGGVDVAHQPMLCQHCGNAPCEAVCPVLATVHSDEGLNQQVYNRCVGTRYCANNCPYKVRRFNWFDYAHDDSLQNLVLNPDVTVRSRGVMEKCTFCVQRIEEAKIEAGGQAVRDGDLQTACQQSCPARAIVFGDLNDPTSQVARATAGPRSYRVLEELNVRPSVSYLALVRNRPAGDEGQPRG